MSYLQTFLNMACGLFLSAFLLRQMGDVEYGLYQSVTAFVTYLVMFEFGIGTVMTRNIALCRSADNTEAIRKNTVTLWYATLALSAVIVGVSVVFCANIGTIYQKTMDARQVVYAQKIFVLMVGYMVVSFLTNTLNGLLLGMEQYTFSKILGVIRILIRLLLLVAVIGPWPHAINLAFIELGVGAGAFLVTYAFCKRAYKLELKWRYFDKKILISSLPLCLALLLQTIINQANTNVGKFVVGVGLSLEGVALYSVAQYIQSMISSVTTIPLSMYMPQVARDVSSGKTGKELTRTLVPSCRLVVIIGGTLLCGLMAVGRQFIQLVYGPDKEIAWLYALIATVPMFINMTTGVVVNVLDVINKRLVRSLVLVAAMLLNIVITVVLLPWCDVMAPFIGVAGSVIIGNIIVMHIYYRKVLKLDVIWLFKEAYRGLLPYQLLSAGVVFWVAAQIKHTATAFLLGGFLYVLLSGTLICLFGLNGDERRQVKTIVNKVKRRV